MNENIDNPDYKNITPFKGWVIENFPFIEADFDAITNYQLISKVVEYLNQVISNENLTEQQIETLTTAYNNLKDYVDNYFSNLDVQEEINQKLDAMAESGELTNLIKNYVDPVINEKFDEQNEVIARINNKVNATYSTPLTASSTSEMTDTTKVYVNTTDGKWYYYTGESWVAGGTYQTPVTDAYLETSANLINRSYKIENFSQYPSFQLGSFNTSTGAYASVTNRCRTGRISPNRRGLVYKIKEDGWKLRVAYYSSDSGSAADYFIDYIDWTTDYVNAYEEENSYILLCLAKDDESDITELELARVNAGEILQISYLTDQTLTILNSPADARIVGDSISNIFRSDTLNKIQTKQLYESSGITTSGENYGGLTNRTRTGRLATSDIGNVIELTDTDYKMQVFYYTSDEGTWPSAYAKECYDWTNKIILDTKYPYFALQFKNNSDTTIDSAARTEINEALISYTLTDKTLTEANVPADAKAVGDLIATGIKNIKILGIGNSYTRDCLRWVCKILMEAHYQNVVVGHGYIGGTTLQQQYESLNEESEIHSSYEYYKYDNTADAVITENQTLDTIFSDEDWDVVIFQQQSDDAGQYTTFVNNDFDINDFITYIKSHINNENLKIGINATWSHNAEYSSSKFIEYYNRNPELQYNAIQSNIPAVADHMSQCDFVINTGLAVNIARSHDYIKNVGVHLLRNDNNHLAYGIPEFMCSYAYLKAITDINISDFNWYPTSTDSASITQTGSYLGYLAKQIADISNSFSQTFNDIK